MATELTFNDYVRLSIDSGVAPLELRFTPIVDVEEGFPFAYRTQTTVHSVVLGDMEERDYTPVGDQKSELATLLLQHNLQHVISALKQFNANGRTVSFLTVRCPSELVENSDMYTVMKDVLEKNPSVKPQKLCLEFPSTLLAKNAERVCTALKDMKLLKIKTAIVGCGDDDFAVSKLTSLTPDFVILSPSATQWAGSRNKPQLFNSLVSYVKSMGAEVITEGEQKYFEFLRHTDCIGFISSESAKLSLSEALAQKEDDEQ